ncbi:hypothetical protein NX794_22575 [Streptomyces sp. LP11]|uniref:Small hydrophilic protein n=1 Tax=Streptomyces pyxinicus TaxID=2970331 RepID=A0ABT2B632_9ACTN|nr:hypothetical protein [Streptomyces sp. LP11]MCS0603972.1 hypothetical protein [Streptomyces sp. LP11]
MAKNKNRKQAGPQNRAQQNERAQERAQRPSAEEQDSSLAGVAGGPADDVHQPKKRKSFGHN